MSSKTGIKKHGTNSIATLRDEFLQLHETHTFALAAPNRLTKTQKISPSHDVSIIKVKGMEQLSAELAPREESRNCTKFVKMLSPKIHSDLMLLTSMI